MMKQMSPTVRPSAPAALRGLLDQGYQRPVLNVLLDLDPSRFATARARAAQLGSLLDEASKRTSELEAKDRPRLEQALEHIRAYVESDAFPPQDAIGLAIFADGADLFEVLSLRQAVQPFATIADRPAIDLLPGYEEEPRWGVVLVSRRAARLFVGPADLVSERASVWDEVHQKHSQGGWSQSRYQRSVEEEMLDHLKSVTDAVQEMDRRLSLDFIVVGGTAEVRAEFERRLPEAIRERIAGSIDVDVERASVEEVRDRVAPLADRVKTETERGLLEQLAERLGRNDRAVAGLAAVRTALDERRVERVICAAGFDLPEEVVSSALEQNAAITFLRKENMNTSEPIAAILRF
jgi:peptide chain release factor subunit 1